MAGDVSPSEGALVEAQRTVALLERLIATAPVGLALLDARGSYLHVNEVLSRLHGLPADAHIGRTVTEVLPGMAGAIPELIAQVVRNGEAVVGVEVAGRTPADPTADQSWLASFYPVQVDQDSALVVGAVVVDMTQRKQEERERSALLAATETARTSAERVATRLARLQLVTAALTGAVGTQGVAEAVFSALWDTLGARDAAVWVLDEDLGELRLEASSTPLPNRMRIAVGAPLPTTDVVHSGEALFIRDQAERLERWPTARSDAKVEAVAVLPLNVESRRLGVLAIWFEQAYDFSGDDRQFMIAMAGHCAHALEQGRLYDQARLALEALNRLQRVASQLVSVDRMEELASLIVEAASSAVGATAGYLALPDADGAAFELVATHGYPDQVANWPPIPIDADLPLAEAVRTNSSIWVPSLEYGHKRWPATIGEPIDPRAYVVLPLSAEGRVIGAMGYSWPDNRVLASRDMVELTTLADQCAQALVRVRLHDAEQRARRDVEFLAEASRQLTSLEYDETMCRALDLLVPAVADGCALFAVEGDELTLFDTRGATTTIRDAASGLATGAQAPKGLAMVGRSGASQLFRTVTVADIRQLAAGADLSPDALMHLESLGITSVMTVAVSGRDRPVGVLSLVTTGARRRFDADDLAVVEDLGRRAGIALENALLYRDQAEVAATLQRSLLPPVLPSPEGLDLAARYRPAGKGTEVGGDFYDIFWRPGPADSDGQWIVMVGDVVGTGPRAAATTALVRHTARAVSAFLGSPSEVAAAVNRALIETEQVQAGEWSERFCTLALGGFRRRDGGWDVELISAGHPPALVMRSGGVTPEAIPARGLLIGQFEDARWDPERVHLGPGDALVLYTDGVTEARRGDSPSRHLFGERRLSEAITSAASSATGIADAVEAAVLSWTGGDVADDVAILVIQAVAAPEPALAPGVKAPVEESGGGGGTATFSGDVREVARSLPPDPRSVRDARHAVSVALQEWGVDPAIVERVALIVTELVTNAVLHAATPVGVAVQWDGSAARLEVVDGSPAHPAPIAQHDEAVTGRGLSLVDALADAWGATPEPHGKTVWAVVGGEAPATEERVEPPAPVGTHVVCLLGVPMETFRAVVRHDDTIIRELELLAIGAGSPSGGGGIPDALRDLVHRARGGFVSLREPFRRAAAEGPETGIADLEVLLTSVAPAGLRRYVDLVERAEESMGEDRFLSDAPSADLRRLRAWVSAEVTAQIVEGREPTRFSAAG